MEGCAEAFAPQLFVDLAGTVCHNEIEYSHHRFLPRLDVNWWSAAFRLNYHPAITEVYILLRYV